MLKGDHFWEVQRPSEVGACWSEGPLMQSTLLRTGEAILCSAHLQAREAGLPGGSVCVSSPSAGAALKGGGWGNSQF